MAESLAWGLAEVRRALAEDHAARDVTTQLFGDAADAVAELRFEAEARLVVAGVPIVAAVFHELDPTVTVAAALDEGSWAPPGTTIATARGPARALLAGERVALNFLQRLSGVATIPDGRSMPCAGPAPGSHTRGKRRPDFVTSSCTRYELGTA